MGTQRVAFSRYRGVQSSGHWWISSAAQKGSGVVFLRLYCWIVLSYVDENDSRPLFWAKPRRAPSRLRVAVVEVLSSPRRAVPRQAPGARRFICNSTAPPNRESLLRHWRTHRSWLQALRRERAGAVGALVIRSRHVLWQLHMIKELQVRLLVRSQRVLNRLTLFRMNDKRHSTDRYRFPDRLTVLDQFDSTDLFRDRRLIDSAERPESPVSNFAGFAGFRSRFQGHAASRCDVHT